MKAVSRASRTLLLVAVAACLAQTAAAQTAVPRPMTTDDALGIVGLGSALLTPDGRSVLFERSELNWDENKRKSTYHLIPADSGEVYPYIGEEGGSGFRFSPDGRFLAFTRPVEKKAQLFVLRTAGGEAQQITKHEVSVGAFRWAPNGERLFFVSDDPRTKEEEAEHKKGLDAVFVDEGPNGQDEGRWRNFWSVDRATQKTTRLTKDSLRVGDFDVSPDGSRIVFTARRENRRNQNNLSELYLLTLADTSVVRLTENEAPESDPQWAPDGRRVAYQAADDEKWELRQAKLYVMDVDARTPRLVSAAFPGTMREYAWMPDGERILFNGLWRTNTNLYRLNVGSGAVTQVTDVEGTLSVRGFSKDRSRMVYAFGDLDTPDDLFVSPTDRLAPVRLTDLNPLVRDSLLLARAEVVRWKSADSLEVEGLLLLPPGADEDLPLLLHIHGGPAGVFTNDFRPQYHVWAGLGYAQLLPNVRGSSGYGDDLLRGNMRDIGGGDYHDLMTGVDYAVARGITHPDSLALRGWSYGGILGGWTITQTDRFKAASLGAMVSDWTSEYGPGFNHDVRLWYIGGTPWENPEAWREKSALTHVANVTTPTLLLHGIEDRTDTEAQSMMFFAALKDQGKTVRYIRFPREPHGFREPRHQRVRDVEEIRWIQQHLRGLDWKPWERPKSEKKDEKAEGKDAG